MSTRPRNSLRTRRECFEKHRWTHSVTGRTMLTCHICKGPIWLGAEKWEAEHVIRRVLKESDSPEDVMPAHVLCHRPKTAADNRETAKGKRVSEFHHGIKQQSRSVIPGSKRSPWKKKISGEVVRR